MKIKITADSIVDLWPEYIKENDITLVPFYITFGSDEYIDGVTCVPDDIYKFVEKTGILPKTAAVSQERFKKIFEEYSKEYDAVIHFNISSDMSVSYQNACAAAEGFNNVYVIDSMNLSSAVGLLVMHAVDLRNSGLSAPEIVEDIKKRIPYVQASFVIDKLDYLHKGGRCSSLTLLGANMLKIKPSIEVHNGKMGIGKKYIGAFRKCLMKYIKDTLETYNNPDYTRVMITHTLVSDECRKEVYDYVKSHTSFAEIYDTSAGCTITSHCGPNTFGILYINDGRSQK